MEHLRLMNDYIITNKTFAYQEVKGVKEVKELRRMSCSSRQVRCKVDA